MEAAGTEGHCPEPEIVTDGSAPPREGEHGDDGHARRDRRSLVVSHLVGAARQAFEGDVEAREATRPAADEDAEDEYVPEPPEAEREAQRGGCNAEGDDVGERIEVRAEGRGVVPAAGDRSVGEIAGQGEDEKGEVYFLTSTPTGKGVFWFAADKK